MAAIRSAHSSARRRIHFLIPHAVWVLSVPVLAIFGWRWWDYFRTFGSGLEGDFFTAGRIALIVLLVAVWGAAGLTYAAAVGKRRSTDKTIRRVSPWWLGLAVIPALCAAGGIAWIEKAKQGMLARHGAIKVFITSTAFSFSPTFDVTAVGSWELEDKLRESLGDTGFVVTDDRGAADVIVELITLKSGRFKFFKDRDVTLRVIDRARRCVILDHADPWFAWANTGRTLRLRKTKRGFFEADRAALTRGRKWEEKVAVTRPGWEEQRRRVYLACANPDPAFRARLSRLVFEEGWDLAPSAKDAHLVVRLDWIERVKGFYVGGPGAGYGGAKFQTKLIVQDPADPSKPLLVIPLRAETPDTTDKELWNAGYELWQAEYEKAQCERRLLEVLRARGK